MAIDIGIGGGDTVQVEPPSRADFEDNLRGAVAYTLARWIFSILAGMGEGLGEFVGGFLVRFLDRLEPDLVEYAAPLIDRLLALDELEPAFAEVLTKLKNPTAAAGATLLMPFMQQALGSFNASLLGVMQAPAVHLANKDIRPTLPSLGDVIAMERFGVMGEKLASDTLGWLGYKPSYINSYKELLRTRPGPEQLVEMRYRGLIDAGSYANRMAQYGFTTDEYDLIYSANERLLDVGTILERYRRRAMDYTDAIAKLGQLGISPENANHILGNADTYLSIADYVQMYRRGTISPEVLRDRLTTMGIVGEDIEAFIAATSSIPGPSDLVRFAVREAYPGQEGVVGATEGYPAQFGEAMALWGYDETWAEAYWKAHWNLPSVNQVFEMLHRGVITDLSTVETYLRVADYPQDWRDRLLQISYDPLTRVDVRRMHALGVLDDAGVLKAYMDIGYNETNAELLLQFTKAYNADTEIGPSATYRTQTRTLTIRAYGVGAISRGEAYSQLTAVGIPDTEAQLLLDLAEWDRELDLRPDLVRQERTDIRNMVERGFALGTLSRDNASALLSGVGFESEQIATILGVAETYQALDLADTAQSVTKRLYTSGAINRQTAISSLVYFGLSGEAQDRILTLWDLERGARDRHLTEAQYRRAVEEGVISVDKYRDKLALLGYTDEDISIITQTYFE